MCGSKYNDYSCSLVPLPWLRPRYQGFYPPLLWCHQCKCQPSEKSQIMPYHFYENSSDLVEQQKDLRDLQRSLDHTMKLLLQTTVSFIIISPILYLYIREFATYILLSNSQSTVHSKYILTDDASFLNLRKIMWKGLWKIVSTVGWSACSTIG